MRYVLGVDGGNSKTQAAVVDETGRLLALARGGGSNYQGIGRRAAGEALGRLLERARADAGLREFDVAVYGLSGADRDKDFAVFREILAPLDRSGKMVLVNDTLLALRAGTVDGVGVALIGGAGSNCIGMNRQGVIRKAWGLGSLTGDRGNAPAIALDAVAAAMRGVDGRGPRTALEEKFKAALGLERLEDIIEFEFVDRPRPFNLGDLAPLVFVAANEGDGAAISVLRAHGLAAASAALAVMRGLFTPAEEVPLVLGGSVYQKGANPTLVETLRAEVAKEFPRVLLVILKEPPILGALLRGWDELGIEPGPETVRRLSTALCAYSLSKGGEQ
jgi:N-acetylglucosamine kinase-like BadF-type ATPase